MIITETTRRRITGKIRANRPALPIGEKKAAPKPMQDAARGAATQRGLRAKARPAVKPVAQENIAAKAERVWAEAKRKPFNFGVSAGGRVVDFRDVLKTSGVDWKAHIDELGGAGLSHQSVHKVATANGGVTALGLGFSGMIDAAKSEATERPTGRFRMLKRG